MASSNLYCLDCHFSSPPVGKIGRCPGGDLFQRITTEPIDNHIQGKHEFGTFLRNSPLYSWGLRRADHADSQIAATGEDSQCFDVADDTGFGFVAATSNCFQVFSDKSLPFAGWIERPPPLFHCVMIRNQFSHGKSPEINSGSRCPGIPVFTIPALGLISRTVRCANPISSGLARSVLLIIITSAC